MRGVMKVFDDTSDGTLDYRKVRMQQRCNEK